MAVDRSLLIVIDHFSYRSYLLLLLLLLTSAPIALAQNPPSATDEISTLLREAASGNTDAQNNLGVMYYTGEGVPKVITKQ